MKSVLEETRNPHEIARRLKITVEKARESLSNEDLTYLPGWGKVALQKYILDRRHCMWAQWTAQDLIHVHRRMHDRGEITLCHGRDGDWILLYAMPVRKKVSREPYFTRSEYY
jgi:hypothetical protein